MLTVRQMDSNAFFFCVRRKKYKARRKEKSGRRLKISTGIFLLHLNDISRRILRRLFHFQLQAFCGLRYPYGDYVIVR